jgi:tripartite-type tricarboxylate transporter receptor subunit TctC
VTVRAALAALLLGICAGAAAQSFPSKPLRIIVPFPPGGAVDPLVRALASGMTERLGQAVIAENRPGATGTVGMNACAKSAPDGYTLCFVTSDGMVVIPALGATLPFDVEKDFQPVTLLGSSKPVLVASANSPFDTFKGLVAYARANPGKVNFGTFGEGGSSHQLLEAIQHGTGTKMTNVPYKGTGPALQAAIAGEVNLALSILPVVQPHIQAGKLKPLMVVARTRLAALPAVPTYEDEALPLVRATWFAIVAPAGVPPNNVARLHETMAAVLADKAWRERFMRDDSYDVSGEGPQEFARFLEASRADGKAIADLLRAGGYRPQ